MIATAPLTGEQFDALPEEEARQWELLSGELIEVSSATPKHQLIMARLLNSLTLYFDKNTIGAAIPDVDFALNADTRLRPDLGIVLNENWKNLDQEKAPIAGAPDIAVEIISPSERTVDSYRKVVTYLKHGVREVWQIFPLEGSVLVYTQASSLIVLNLEDRLISPLLPGWDVVVSKALNA